MGVLFLDIETLAQDPEPFMVPARDEIKVPKTHKKPETIAAYLDEQEASIVGELREKSSLEPLLGGTVLAVGLALADGPVGAILPKAGDEEGERGVLTRLQEKLAARPDDVLVTWNGARFDMEFLRKRALRHGLWSLAQRTFFEKPWSRGHIDLFPVWQGHDKSAMGKLRAVASFLGIESPDHVRGSQIAELFRAGRVDLVRQHVLEDVRVLREVYWRFRAAGWVVADDQVPDTLPIRPCRVAAPAPTPQAAEQVAPTEAA
jgi:DNA polymerase elongation subunit (family B)